MWLLWMSRWLDFFLSAEMFLFRLRGKKEKTEAYDYEYVVKGSNSNNTVWLVYGERGESDKAK